jgi:hypothetical protein
MAPSLGAINNAIPLHNFCNTGPHYMYLSVCIYVAMTFQFSPAVVLGPFITQKLGRYSICQTRTQHGHFRLIMDGGQ